MPITGAHVVLHSPQADELRAVLRDVFGWEHVEDTPGWLIFKLPPAELGVHPSDGPKHELSLVCDDIVATVNELRARGSCSATSRRSEASASRRRWCYPAASKSCSTSHGTPRR